MCFLCISLFDMEEQKKLLLFEDFPGIPTEDWENKIKADLKGADYQKKLIWLSDDGINVKPYYREEDLDKLDYLKNIFL